MFEAEPMERGDDGQVEPKVYLLSATPDPLGAIAAACMMYEGKVCRDISKVTYDERMHYWQQVQKTHLKAPLEFVDLHFMIEGVTRSFTHQMVRQRTAVYAQESLRFAVKGDFVDEVPLPPSIRPGSDAAVAWRRAVLDAQEAYQRMVSNGVPAEDARGLLPHSITTRLNYKTNLRNLLDHAGNRLCTQAQFEWRAVFIGIVKAIAEYDPTLHLGSDHWPVEPKDSSVWSDWQFRHIAESQVFKPVCFSLGHCPFTADFDRQCTIRERVQEGRFEDINPAEWMADPTAGRRDDPTGGS